VLDVCYDRVLGCDGCGMREFQVRDCSVSQRESAVASRLPAAVSPRRTWRMLLSLSSGPLAAFGTWLAPARAATSAPLDVNPPSTSEPTLSIEVGTQLAATPGDVCFIDLDVASCEPGGLWGLEAGTVFRLRRWGAGLVGAFQWGRGDELLLNDGTPADTSQMVASCALLVRYSLSDEWMSSWVGAQLGGTRAIYALETSDARTDAASGVYAPLFGLEAGGALLAFRSFSLDLKAAARVTPFPSGYLYVGGTEGGIGIDYPSWVPWFGVSVSGRLQL
jgi:hypothetical protein